MKMNYMEVVMSDEKDPEAKAGKIAQNVDQELRPRNDSIGAQSEVSRTSSEEMVEFPEQLEQLKQEVERATAPPRADAFFRKLKARGPGKQSLRTPRIPTGKGGFGWHPK